MQPTKAKTGIVTRPKTDRLKTIAKAAPREAPEEALVVYGSAIGLRKRP